MVIGTHQRSSDQEVAGRAHIEEQTLDRALPAWRSAAPPATGGKWSQLRDWAARGNTTLERAEELRERLGDNALMFWMHPPPNWSSPS